MYQPRGDFRDLHVRLPAELTDRLDRFCNQRVVSRAYVVARAVEAFLDGEEEL
jgi:predicted transcriptional regulator